MTVYRSNQFTVPAAQSGGGDPLSLPLLDPAAIQYIGAFRLPDEEPMSIGGTTNGAIAFNPANNSLFICGRGPDDGTYGKSNVPVSEFSIPQPIDGPVASLNTATRLQPYVSVCGGRQSEITTGNEGNDVCGITVYNGRLVIHVGTFYLNGTQNASLFVRTSLNLSGGSVIGPFAPSGVTNQRYLGAGGGMELPDNWKPVFGGLPVVGGGGGGLSIVGNLSNGPTMYFFDPEQAQSDGSSIAAQAGTYYPDDKDIGDYNGGYGVLFTGMSTHRGTIFLENYRTILCFGRHGDSVYLGGGQVSNVQVRDRFWLMDAQDVKDAFDGQVANNSVVPYGFVDFDASYSNSGIPQGENEHNRGCTYDPATKTIYAVTKGEDPADGAIVHVYRIND